MISSMMIICVKREREKERKREREKERKREREKERKRDKLCEHLCVWYIERNFELFQCTLINVIMLYHLV